MKKVEIQLEPLTAKAFAPFGDVLEIENAKSRFSINHGTVERHHDLTNIDVNSEGGRTLVSIITCNEPACLPYTLSLMECHPLGSQSFIPMDNTQIVIAVAKSGESPKPEAIRAFISNGTQGINYHRGVWHMPILFLNSEQRMIVIDRGGSRNNLQERHYPEHEIILVEQP